MAPQYSQETVIADTTSGIGSPISVVVLSKSGSQRNNGESGHPKPRHIDLSEAQARWNSWWSRMWRSPRSACSPEYWMANPSTPLVATIYRIMTAFLQETTRKIPISKRIDPKTWQRAQSAYKKSLPVITKRIKEVKTKRGLDIEHAMLSQDLLLSCKQSARRRHPKKCRQFWTEQLQKMAQHREKMYREAKKQHGKRIGRGVP